MKREFKKTYLPPTFSVTIIEHDFCLAVGSTTPESNPFEDPIEIQTEFTTQELTGDIQWN